MKPLALLDEESDCTAVVPANRLIPRPQSPSKIRRRAEQKLGFRRRSDGSGVIPGIKCRGCGGVQAGELSDTHAWSIARSLAFAGNGFARR